MNGNVETPTEHIEQNHIDNDDAVSHEVHITVEQQAILKAVRAIMCIEALQNVGNIQKTARVLKKLKQMLSDLNLQYLWIRIVV